MLWWRIWTLHVWKNWSLSWLVTCSIEIELSQLTRRSNYFTCIDNFMRSKLFSSSVNFVDKKFLDVLINFSIWSILLWDFSLFFWIKFKICLIIRYIHSSFWFVWRSVILLKQNVIIKVIQLLMFRIFSLASNFVLN